jgi:hypothetical protein
MRLSLTPSGYQNFLLNFSLELGPLLTSPKPPHHRSWPRSRTLRAAIFLNLSRWGRRPRWPCPQAHDADLEPATLSSSWARDDVHHVPFPSPQCRWPTPSLGPQRCHPPRAYDVQSSWCHRIRAILEPRMLSSSLSPQGYIVYFLCHFGPTNHDFDMLHCHIYLICYIDFVLLHCFDVLYCHIALICYIAFDMLHFFDMLHCHIAQWRKWAKWDECGNMDKHYYTIKISASNNKQQIGNSIKLKV